MRHIVLPIAALLCSNVAFASDLACSSNPDPKARLACYDKMAATIDDCQSQQDKLDRLVCFDNLSTAIQTALTGTTSNVKPAPTTASTAVIAASAATPEAPIAKPTPQVSAQTSEASFGAEMSAEKLESITSTVKNVKTDPYKKWTLTLENGQRWKQLESDRMKIKTGDTVVIKRASFGSFLLSKSGTSRTSRVKRL